MNMINNNLISLPEPEQFIKICRALALADAILMPDWEYRYFSFNSNWDGEEKEMMASMKNGEGGEYFILFSDKGIVGKLYDVHKGSFFDELQSSLPLEFSDFLQEPAFDIENSTSFIWRKSTDKNWQCTPKIQETGFLRFITGGEREYVNWAEDYYEVRIDRDLFAKLFSNLLINEELVKKANPENSIELMSKDLEEILNLKSE